MAWPVTNEAESEQSQTKASATSSGLPNLSTGWQSNRNFSSSGLRVMERVTSGVLIASWQIAFTRIPAFAYSSTTVLVIPTTPCLEAVYGEIPGVPMSPDSLIHRIAHPNWPVPPEFNGSEKEPSGIRSSQRLEAFSY